jgi:hypothetical protein
VADVIDNLRAEIMIVVNSCFKILHASIQYCNIFYGSPKSGAIESCVTRVGSGLTRKHETRFERPARYKHSSVPCCGC